MPALTEEQAKFYDDNGYVVVDVLTDEEVEVISKDYDAIFKRKAHQDLEARWGGDWDKSKEKLSVHSIHGMQMHSAIFTRILLNERLLDACEAVMRTPNILLHHTKAHSKPPGKGSPFPMHQDYPYFPYKNDSMVAVFINLDHSSPENGGLCVYPGSHKLGPLKDVSTDPSFHYLDRDEYPIEKATPLTLKKGQVVIFSYLLIHGSYPNNSDRGRRMLLIQLVGAEDTPLAADTHRSAAQGLVLRGENISRDADIKARVQGY